MRKFIAIIALLVGVLMVSYGFFKDNRNYQDQDDHQVVKTSTKLAESSLAPVSESTDVLAETMESSTEMEEPMQLSGEQLALKELLDDRMHIAGTDNTPWNRIDISYGGSQVDLGNSYKDIYDNLVTTEKPIGSIKVPKVKIDKDFYQGIGVAENGELSNGNELRMMAPVTWRLGQVLGGDNYILLSHVDYDGDLGKWFTPLLRSLSSPNQATRDIGDLLLSKGDEIIITEYDNEIEWVFEIDDFGQTTSQTAEGQLQEGKKFLDRSPGEPRITLQGCLYDTGQKFFISGKLVRMEKDETIYTVE